MGCKPKERAGKNGAEKTEEEKQIASSRVGNFGTGFFFRWVSSFVPKEKNSLSLEYRPPFNGRKGRGSDGNRRYHRARANR